MEEQQRCPASLAYRLRRSSMSKVVNEQFVGAGAPRGVRVGLRYAWD